MDRKHGNPNRREVMKKTIESADGKFKFRVILDFMQNMPEEYRYVPYCGNIAGGCCDKDGNLYCGLRGGSFMSPYPLSCYLQLDKDGNFVRAVGSGNIPGMHFGEISPDGKRLLFADVAGNRIVGLDLESGEAATALAPFHDRPTNHVNKNALTDWRMHKGIIATEPLHEEGCGGSFEWYQQRVNMTCGEPFHNPTDIDYDSQGQWRRVCGVRGRGLRSFHIPIRPKRCDHFRLRLEGVGSAKVFSLCKTITEGGSRL